MLFACCVYIYIYICCRHYRLKVASVRTCATFSIQCIQHSCCQGEYIWFGASKVEVLFHGPGHGMSQVEHKASLPRLGDGWDFAGDDSKLMVGKSIK